MYRIGDLSALSRIPVKTLRFYDAEKILCPVMTDSFTGYRYYSASQLSDCYTIVKLKSLGFTLAEIKEYLGSTDEQRMTLLSIKEQLLIKLRDEVTNNIDVLHKLNISLKESEPMHNIIVRKSDSFTIASVRQIFPDRCRYEDVSSEIRCKISSERIGDRTVIIDYCTDYRETDLDIEIGIEIRGKTPIAGINTRTLMFSEDTVNLVCSSNDRNEAVIAVSKFIAENNYQTTGGCVFSQPPVTFYSIFYCFICILLPHTASLAQVSSIFFRSDVSPGK